MSEPTELPVTEEPTSTPWQERRGVVAVLAGGLVALVVLGGYFVLFSGGNSDAPSAEITAIGAPSTAATAPPTAEPVPTTVPAEFTGDLGRDPFEPLYPPAETGGSAPDPAANDAPPSQAIPPAAPGTAPVVPSQPLPDAGVTTGGSTTDAPVRITLVEIRGTDLAVVKVAGSRSEVGKGDTFASKFQVDALYPDEGLATFRYGDVSFTLKVGQSATF